LPTNIKQLLIDTVLKENKSFAGKVLFSLIRLLYSHDLRILSVLYKTDKWGDHSYAQHYNKHLSKYRRKKIRLLEIGIGGYDDPGSGGGSLKAWKAYFKKAQIFAFDIHTKTVRGSRIRVFRGDQSDKDFLTRLASDHGPFDIIIDDGSHINTHVTATFELLFRNLNPGGLYLIEDTQTSYFEEKYGGSADPGKGDTIMNYFKSKTDCLNHVEFPIEHYAANYFDKHIVAMHFYHNLIIVEKGLNNEKSNIVKDHKRTDL
jgi:hypothetical protein